MLQRHALSTTASHLLHVSSRLERLGEVADVAFNVLVAVHGEWYDGLYMVSVIRDQEVRKNRE